MWPERVNPGSNTRNFWVGTTQASADPSSMALRIGNTLHYDLILAPSCYDPLPASRTSFTVSTAFADLTCFLDRAGDLDYCLDEHGNRIEPFEVTDLRCSLPGENGERVEFTVTFGSPDSSIGGGSSPDCCFIYWINWYTPLAVGTCCGY